MTWRRVLATFLLGLGLAASPALAGEPEGRSATEPPLVPLARPALIVGELDTAHFHILYTAEARAAAEALAPRIEETRESFSHFLGHEWPGATEVRLGVGRKEFEAIAIPGGAPPGWAVALAYPQHHIILLNAISLASDDGQVTLKHELAHVALGALGSSWPHWFQEGLAQVLTGERFNMSHYATLFRAVRQDRLLHFEDLADSWPDEPGDVQLAYAQSAAFVDYLAGRFGSAGMSRLVDEVQKGGTFEAAFARAFHTTLTLEETAWRKELPARYRWLPTTTTEALLWIAASLLCMVAFVRRSVQKKHKLAELEAEEAAELAALRLLEASAAAAEAASAPQLVPETGDAVAPAPDSSPDGAPSSSGPERVFHVRLSRFPDAAHAPDADAGVEHDESTPLSKPTLH